MGVKSWRWPDVVQALGLIAALVGLFRVVGVDYGLLLGGTVVILAGAVGEAARLRAGARAATAATRRAEGAR